MLTHVHYDETLRCWQFGIKGDVVEVLGKEKAKEEEDRTLGRESPVLTNQWGHTV
jgi:hypothetical protein